jgi:hypothetical protein
VSEDASSIKEVLDHIRTDPIWQQIWEFMLDARQDALIRMAGVENWDQYLMVRGEFNAINMLLEWGDQLADRLEEARRRGDENGRSRQG